jgi:hypothetical protein
MARGKARSRTRGGTIEAAPDTPVAPIPSRTRAFQVATALLRHGAPLAALVVLRSSVHTYLLLVLFDLGVGYAGQQLRHRAATTPHALDAAETVIERALAWLQLPLLMAFAGLLFVFTAMLFLLPFLAAFLWTPLAAAVKHDAAMIFASVAITSVAGARQLDQAMAAGDAATPGFRSAADRGAKQALMMLALFLGMAPYALIAGPSIGVWLLATLFTALLCAVDLGWKPRRLR